MQLNKTKDKKLEFDLFKLHNNVIDLGNKSWICFYGKDLPNIIDAIKTELIKKYSLVHTSELVRIVAQKLHCKNWIAAQVLYNHTKWVPISVLDILIRLTNNPNKYKKAVLNDISLIKCNSATSKPVIAVKQLNINLCKIAGAHAGDGNLYNSLGIEIKNPKLEDSILKILKKNNIKARIFKTQNKYRIKIKNINTKTILKLLNIYRKNQEISLWFSYGINIAEMYKNSVKAYAEWVRDVFGIKVRVTKYKTKNAWRADFDNKIIARYLINFLGFPAGVKTYTVKEPKVIRNAPLEFRKAFLLGVMTFEGYTRPRNRSIGFSSKSIKLSKSVYDIVIRSGIPINQVKEDNYGRFVCESRVLNKNDLIKALDIFEENTEKWFRIKNNL